ncbi:type II CRISPR RNA-guided endonuclease Cas9 [Clostridium sp.]|uniref:type II CRISPR RNA-guided endonuclease Cas9 n=1 Tax=Clostridium sp. TaxID=1506 RepID=UPI003464A391
MKYSIGLDIGTNSCGIAVINEEYKLVKAKGKNIWGAVKFDEGQTAKERRSYRGARRLQVRKKRRIRLFREIIEKEIYKVDPTFFHRLEDSFLYQEDKRNTSSKYNLFIDENYNDRKYFEEYPTIYHLRKRLVTDSSQCDIRLVYLAIHHILKYRGNFLSEGQSFDEISSNGTILLDELFEIYSRKYEININLDTVKIISILEDKKKSKKDKVKEICEIQGVNSLNKATAKELANGFVGLQMDLKKIFLDVEFEDNNKIKLSDSTAEEKYVALEDVLGEDFIILEKIKGIYNIIQLKDILGNKQDGSTNSSISEAMIVKYEKFRSDLVLLKKVIRENCPREIYNEIFKSKDRDVASYENYINNKIKAKAGSDNRKTFYDKIKKVLSTEENEDINYILKEIDEERFLIKLNTRDNSIIPYQLHEMELSRIIDNQGKYYSDLKENKDNILEVLKFRIPYYIGPLNENSKFGWLQRQNGEDKTRILPWNYKKVIDIDVTAKEFIERMTNYCTYLPDEKVLPFNSILYTLYLYYNEINKVEFNNNKLDKTEKEKLKNEVFLKNNVVTEKKLKEWYIQEINRSFSDITVTKLQGEGKANVTLKPIRDFNRIYGNITEDNIAEIETIIYWLTVYEDKKIVARRLRKELKLPEKKIKEILKLRYTGWGRFSRKLLEGIKSVNDRYSPKSIIEVLRDTNLNFMQIINDDYYGFNKIIDEVNGSDRIEKINFEKDIKPLQGSPSLKKGIGQAVKQLEEVINLMGDTPQNIFIEFAREDQGSKRTIARREKMLKLYDEIEGLDSDDKEIIKILKDSKTKIDNERLYLYFIQRGKCMYTQESLNIDELQYYQIDHIIPRSLIKDDSLSNKVLVKSMENQNKSAMELRSEIINRNRKWWSDLLKCNLISKRKYDNLVHGSQNLKEKVEKDFINRQLVEVRQVSKHVTNLLRRAYGHNGTNVVAIKASLVDDFKSQYNIYKSREINDFHHAKDAYVTAFVGQYILNRYPSMKAEFIYDDYLQYKISVKDKGRDKYGFIISSMKYNFIDRDTGEVLWDANEKSKDILKVLSYNDCIITRKTEVMSGGMFNLTRMPKIEKEKLTGKEIPLRNNKNTFLPPEKYGYYNGVQESYYSVIEFTDKKKRVKRLVGVPIMVSSKLKNSKDGLYEYFAERYKDVKIIKERIPKYQKIRVDGNEYYIVSSNEWCNATQLILSKDTYNNIARLNDRSYFNKQLQKVLDEALNKAYEELIIKFQRVYSMYGSTLKKLVDGKEKFKELEPINKLQVINGILKLTKADSQCGNLKLIGGTDREGRINGKENIDVNKITFIYESPLGINRREVQY